MNSRSKKELFFSKWGVWNSGLPFNQSINLCLCLCLTYLYSLSMGSRDTEVVELSAQTWIDSACVLSRQAPLSMRFYWQEYWSGLPFPPPGDLPDPGIEPTSPASPALEADSYYWVTGEAQVENEVKVNIAIDQWLFGDLRKEDWGPMT